MHFPASCPVFFSFIQFTFGCCSLVPFASQQYFAIKITLKSQNLNKLSHLIITLNNLCSIVINISSVSTFSEAMNYILHKSALPCSRTDSIHNLYSGNTNHMLYITLTFIACCHVNSSQNQTKSIESQSYPLQVFFLHLVLETGPEHTAKWLAYWVHGWRYLRTWSQYWFVMLFPSSHIFVCFTHFLHALAKCFILLCIFIAMQWLQHEPCPPDLL